MTYRYDEIPSLTDMVAAVRAHALAKADYATNGWDYVIEAYEDEEIMEEIRFCRSHNGALKVMAEIARLKHENRVEHIAAAKYFGGET